MPLANRCRPAASVLTAILSHAANLILVLSLFLLAACGGGGGGSAPDASVSGQPSPGGQPNTAAALNFVTVTQDDYGLVAPNFYYTSDNATFWSVQAAVAKDVTDPDFACVIRIDIPKPAGDSVDALVGKTYSIDEVAGYTRFPGDVFVFDGHKSVRKSVDHGTITFTSGASARNYIEGEFDVTLTDYDSKIVPSPRYRLAGRFGFTLGSYGPAIPLLQGVYPDEGRAAYDRLCSGCHMLGTYDSVVKSASDLSMRGGELPTVFPGAVPGHQGLALDQQTFWDLRIFLNAK